MSNGSNPDSPLRNPFFWGVKKNSEVPSFAKLSQSQEILRLASCNSQFPITTFPFFPTPDPDPKEPPPPWSRSTYRSPRCRHGGDSGLETGSVFVGFRGRRL